MAPLNHFKVVTPRGTQMPVERCGHRIFADDNYIYLIGGCNRNPSPKRTLSDAWRFNRLTQSWLQCTMADATFPLPDSLASSSLVSRGPGPDFNSGSNEAYIFGGTKLPVDEQSNSNSLYWVRIDRAGRVHLKLQTVQVQGEEPLPAQHHQSMCRRLETNQAGKLCEVIYIVGGTTGYELNMDIWKLQRPAGADLDQSWDATRLNRRILDDDDELGRYNLELVARGQKLYSFDFIRLDELTIFDLNSNQFEQLPTRADPEHGFPPQRRFHALVHRQNMVYLLGGCDQETIIDTVWRFDLDSLEWTQLLTSLPVPVFVSSAAISPDGCIFVFGGITWQTDENPCSDVNCLQSMWLLPPSLVHIAADQLLKGISERQLKELTEEGVRLADVPQLVTRILCPQDEENNAAAEAAPPPTHTLAAEPYQATADQKEPSLFSTFLDWICCRPRSSYYC